MELVDSRQYYEAVHKVIELLEGKSTPLLARLRQEMEAASEALEFEAAARLRDQIRAVERTVERQATVLPGGGDMDVIGLFAADKGLALGIVFVRNGAMTDGRTFYWSGLCFEDAPELLWSFVGQYYGTMTPPPRILLPWLPPDNEAGEAPEDGEAEPEATPAESTEPAPAEGEGGGNTVLWIVIAVVVVAAIAVAVAVSKKKKK